MSFADYLENKLLDHLLGGATYSQLTTVYIGLSTTTPTDSGGNFTEPSSGYNYSRVSVLNAIGDGKWSTASGGSKSNAAIISFPQASDVWGEVTHFGIFDQATGGNCLATGLLSTPKTIGALDTVQFSIGNLIVTLD